MKKIFVWLVVFYLTIFSWAGKAWAIDYVLPYPGMLPDNPLYIFKVLRDKVTTAFIADPTQRAFYFLFLSDKRLAAGEALRKKGNTGLAATTFLKSEDYFRQAVDLATKKRSENLLAKLLVAGAKHSEVLIKVNVPKAYQDSLESQKRVMDLVLKK